MMTLGFFRNVRIGVKLVMLNYIVILLPIVLLFGGYSYYLEQRSIQSSVSKAYQEVSKQIQGNVSFLKTDVEDVSSYISINENVKEVLNRNGTEVSEQTSWKSDDSMNFLIDLIASKSYINFISIYAENGTQPFCITTESEVPEEDFEKVKQLPCYKKAIDEKGVPVWNTMKRGNSGLFTTETSSKLVMSRVLTNYSNNQTIGYLVIGVNVDSLVDIFSSMKQLKGATVVFDQAGEFGTYGDIPDEIKGYILSETYLKGREEINSDMVEYKNYFIFYHQEKEVRLRVFNIIPKSVMKEQLTGALFRTFATILVLLLAFATISWYVAKRISRSLNKITESMKKFEKGDFTQQIDYKWDDELGDVILCYNSMVANIKDLIDTTYHLRILEREAELASKQAQINPHFLYNTLDSIYWKALGDGNEELSEMVYSLSRIFRLSLNRGKGMTSIVKEIELVEHYLMIQKMRFGERLGFHIEIEEDLKEGVIPKLMLQPFVENAVIHGIEEKGGEINITVKKEKNQVVFTVQDTGKGMTAEEVNQLLQVEMSDINVSRQPRKYAVSNVYERLSIKYKDNFIFKISSIEQEGTRITIRLPAKEVMVFDIETDG